MGGSCRRLQIRRFGRALLILGISVAALGTAVAASDPANDASDQANGGGGFALQEVVVTATKRAEPLEDVPQAITAITSADLDKRGITDVKELDAGAPNLDIGTASEDSNAVRITLRGVGQGSLDGASDPGVALHVDGVYLGRNSALIGDLIDVDHIEVLRGPQGTLYGRNAPGGAINIITARPTATPDFFGDVTYGNYNEERLRATANVPLTDSLESRVSVFSDTHNGYLRNLYPDSRNPDDKDSHGGRGQLLYTDHNGDTFLLHLYGEQIGGVGPGVRFSPKDPSLANGWSGLGFAGLPVGVQVGVAPTGVLGVLWGNPYTNPRTGAPAPNPSPDLFTVDEDAHQFLDQLLKGSDLTMIFPVGNWSSLKSISAWETDNSNILFDADGGPEPIETIQRLEDARQFSQEFNWSSTSPGPWKWLLGAFFYHEQINESLLVGQQPGVLSLTAPEYIVVPGPTGLTAVPYTGPPGGDGYLMNQTGDDDTLSYALFGQATAPIWGPLSLTAGYRYTWDREKQNNYGTGFVDDTTGINSQTGTTTPAPPAHSAVGYGDWGAHVALTYQLAPDSLLYASWGRGYKAGGFDFNGASVNNARVPYLPEHLNAYEVGSKSELLNHRMVLNVAAFYYKYDDLQTFELTLEGPRTENAANATSKGAELEFDYLITRALQLDASYGYLYARYSRFVGCDIGNCSGNFLNYAPKGTLHLGPLYTFFLPGNAQLQLRLNYSYKSAYYMDEANTYADQQSGYSLWDAGVRWTRSDGKIYVDLYGKNLGNQGYVTSELIGPPFACGCRQINVGDPRTFGITVGARL